MFISMLKKNNFIVFLILLGLTSCSRAPRQASNTFCHEAFEIPCRWESSVEYEVNLEDPCCFLWWDELGDPMLISLVDLATIRNKDILLAGKESKEKLLQTVNTVTSEVAKSYIELRGLQMRLKVLKANIEVQKQIFTTQKGLLNEGFSNLIEENEDKKNLNLLLVQKSLVESSIEKTSAHLSMLLGYPSGVLHTPLCECHDLPELPCHMPVGTPLDLLCRNQPVQDARKEYVAQRNEQTFYNYQTAMLSALENMESALAAFHYEREKYLYLEDTQKVKADSYQLTLDLYNRGFKDERDVLIALQEFLVQEEALIQSKADLLVSYTLLYQALGVGWEACCCK